MPVVSWSGIEEEVPIRVTADVIVAQERTMKLAARLGFGRRAQWELAIAVSEAATNILKFAGQGSILLRGLDRDRKGLEFEARDQGPGIRDPEQAMIDGHSEGRRLADNFSVRDRRGLGCGLGAIKRLMDQVRLLTGENGGARVLARKFL